MKFTPIAASGIAVILLFPTLAATDVIVLKDGTRLEGRIEAAQRGNDRVGFLSGTGRIELSRDRIAEIIEEPDEVDWTHIGRQFLQARNHTEALKMFQAALEANPEHTPAREGLATAQEALEQQQAEQQRTVQQQIDRDLEAIAELIESDEYSEKVYTETETRLNSILTSGDAADRQRQNAQRLLRDLYLAWGFALFDRLDYRGAEDRYMRVQEMDPDNAEARERLLSIWERDPSKRAEVLEVYLRKLADDPNNLELNEKAGDLLYQQRRYAEAIEPLKKVAASPRYAGRGYDIRLRNAFQNAIDEAQGEGEVDRALAMVREMFSLGLTHNRSLLDRLEYESAVMKLPDSDDYWTVRARLAKEKLTTAGLEDYRSRELELILRSDPENEEAIAGFREMSESRIARIQDAMRSEDYLYARDMARAFLESESRFPDLVQTAQELYNTADIEAQRVAREQREVARRLAQNAQDYYERALRDVENMISQERLRQEAAPGRTFNYMSFKQSAINNARHAIDRFELAIKQDPSLAGKDTMDLQQKLADARQLYASLVEPARPLPRQRVWY